MFGKISDGVFIEKMDANINTACRLIQNFILFWTYALLAEDKFGREARLCKG